MVFIDGTEIQSGSTIDGTEIKEITIDGTVAWKAWNPTQASGGSTYTVTQNGITYQVHAFTNTGNSTFSVSDPGTEGAVEALVVGGGGGGGAKLAGGGGAGGVIFDQNVGISANSYTVTVGTGAPRQQAQTTLDYSESAHGDDSTAFGLRAIRGGIGGSHRGDNDDMNTPGTNGGSGGGSGDGWNNPDDNGKAQQPGSVDGGSGNDGGYWGSGTGDSRRYAGGGGGAGEQGDAPSANSGDSSAGGDGLYFGNEFGTSVGDGGWFGGGGGGFWYVDNPPTGYDYSGGLGGGGSAANHIADGVNRPGEDGMANTGGGGGGSSWNKESDGSAGGSGIVLVRYPIEDPN